MKKNRKRLQPLTPAALFTIDGETGQIRVRAGAGLDYEHKDTHAVEVAASSPDGRAAIAVGIAVTDVELPGRADEYDANKDERIDRDEATAAIFDYFADRISRDDVMMILELYFAD